MMTISMWKYWFDEYKENIYYEDYIFSIMFLICFIIFTPILIIVDILTLPIEVFAYIKSKGKRKKDF